MSFEWRGVAIEDVGGGPFALPGAVVAIIESGLLVRWEHYEPSDREGMLARYAELGGRARLPQAVGQTVSERLTAEFGATTVPTISTPCSPSITRTSWWSITGVWAGGLAGSGRSP